MRCKMDIAFIVEEMKVYAKDGRETENVTLPKALLKTWSKVLQEYCDYEEG